VTYRDVTAPSEVYRPPLPATGNKLEFSVTLGPLPDTPSTCNVLIEVASSTNTSVSESVVSVNGKPCEILSNSEMDGNRVMIYDVPKSSLTPARSQQIEIVSTDQNTLTIRRVEMSLDL
jgi:hypothetical protein